jgi:uncharacterized protein YgbK (DUF1537 family)
MAGARVAVISDDLTGALDATAPFALLGWKVLVATSLAAVDTLLDMEADVVAVALGSREETAAEAAMRARAAARRFSGTPCIFKKIDSRMKGNVGAEVGAVALALGLAPVLVCPAIPELGRVVVRGAVAGIGIAEPIPVARAVEGVTAIIPDAASPADLDAAVAGFAGGLLVGARGLAAAVARQMGRKPGTGSFSARLRGPLVIVVGSRDPITLEQVAKVRKLPQADWIGAVDGFVPKGKNLAEVVILQAVDGPGAHGAEVAARLARGLCQDHLAGRSMVVLTGGETAAAALSAMGVGVLDVLGEVLPGLPLCHALNGADGLLIVTKSGGFGDVECLMQVAQMAVAGKAGSRVVVE